jgi:dihydrofolate reductase
LDGSIDWLHFSKDVQQVMTDYWKEVDTIVMGRKTYAVAAANNPKKTKRDKRKLPVTRTCVFSRKRAPGKDICLMGGGELAQSLLAEGLVDRIGLNIHPILPGAGIPTFRDPDIE